VAALADLEVSIVIPCLNEEKTLKNVIDTAHAALTKYGYRGEVVVADNGSTDRSREIAIENGARVVEVSLKGYGSALTAGFEGSLGQFVIIGDADESYDFMEIDRFVEKWKQGYEFVMGTRLRGSIEPGAMPNSHRYLGTPVLTFLINLFFGTHISDCNCGLRGLTRSAFLAMEVHATGMEFASEMIIKASLLKLKMTEVPATLRLDKRDRRPHLNTWKDGWMHLRFILTYAADRLFFIPGLLMVILGAVGFALLWDKPQVIGGLFMDYHFLFPSSLLLILGIQCIQFTYLAKAYTGLAKYNPRIQQLLQFITFERGIVVGMLLLLVGLALNLVIVAEWLSTYGKGLFAIRQAIVAQTLMAVGAQICFGSFFMSVMRIPQRRIIQETP
jgi:glycosyltransferase involved in cell wall biosynthesis